MFFIYPVVKITNGNIGFRNTSDVEIFYMKIPAPYSAAQQCGVHRQRLDKTVFRTAHDLFFIRFADGALRIFSEIDTKTDVKAVNEKKRSSRKDVDARVRKFRSRNKVSERNTRAGKDCRVLQFFFVVDILQRLKKFRPRAVIDIAVNVIYTRTSAADREQARNNVKILLNA